MSTHFFGLLDELIRRSLRMASTVEHIVAEACDAAVRMDDKSARAIIEGDADIDREEVAIEAEVLRLMTLFQPMGLTMRKLCTVLKVNNDLERIADCAVNIAERTCHLHPDLKEKIRPGLERIYPIVLRMLHDVLQAYSTGDEAMARNVRSQDEVIDALYGQFVRDVVAHPAQSEETMATCLDLITIAKNLERIADHVTNIAEDVVFLVTGEIVRHTKH